MTWNPSQYLRYDVERSQPARDLIAALGDADPTEIVDLGCGTGNSTALLEQRWPQASLTGIDGSTEMLNQASQSGVSAAWHAADISTWRPDTPVDLIFSNAALHWLDDHTTLFPQLIGTLAELGALAVQMPYNFSQPSHTLINDIANEPQHLKKINVSQSDALRRLHVSDQAGTIYIGIDAFIAIWKILPRWRLLALICAIPGVRSILSLLYNKFADWKFSRSAHCQISI